AGELRQAGFTVTEGFGKYSRAWRKPYGVIATLKNGDGPTVLLRADMDALPVKEETDLPYASKVTAKDELGQDVSVMHACGHDIHVTNLIGVARLLAARKEQWKGTLLLIGQPAEERGAGSQSLLAAGLYEKFPRPDFAVALHDNADIPAGKIGYRSGQAYANVTSVDLTVRGRGGHGARPQKTKDPVVLAAQIILSLQTIVSREIGPLDPAVVTVGSIHGGTKHNIIPDEVKLQITVRSYKEEVRQQILASIERHARGAAIGAGVPEELAPVMSVEDNAFTPSVFNDPKLIERLLPVWQKGLGGENVVAAGPLMGGEDFARYGLDQKIPIVMFWVGAVAPDKLAESLKSGETLPGLHSPRFAPLAEPTLRTGVKAMTLAALELLQKAPDRGP
ncbi:MAG: amidohydrolase, partial [Bryobacteraceae bacterium]|nr:amidohydrolase [Bryobacteraceae bacterium]